MFGGRLHAFGDDGDAEVAADRQHAAGDGLARAAGVDAAHQRHVELDQVGREVGQQREAGVAGAEVVDRGQEAAALVLAQDAGEPGAVFHALAFGHLEDDAVGGEPVHARRFQRGADADLGLVDRVGHEVDRQPVLQAQLRRGLDGLHAAGLVEAVAVVDRDLVEHPAGALAGGAAHQGLVCPDAARGDVDDGLVGVVELEDELLGVGAARAGIGGRSVELCEVRRGGFDLDHGSAGTFRPGISAAHRPS